MKALLTGKKINWLFVGAVMVGAWIYYTRYWKPDLSGLGGKP